MSISEYRHSHSGSRSTVDDDPLRHTITKTHSHTDSQPFPVSLTLSQYETLSQCFEQGLSLAALGKSCITVYAQVPPPSRHHPTMGFIKGRHLTDTNAQTNTNKTSTDSNIVSNGDRGSSRDNNRMIRCVKLTDELDTIVAVPPDNNTVILPPNTVTDNNTSIVRDTVVESVEKRGRGRAKQVAKKAIVEVRYDKNSDEKEGTCDKKGNRKVRCDKGKARTKHKPENNCNNSSSHSDSSKKRRGVRVSDSRCIMSCNTNNTVIISSQCSSDTNTNTNTNDDTITPIGIPNTLRGKLQVLPMYNNNTRNTTSSDCDSDDLNSEGYSDASEHSSGKMYSMLALWPHATNSFTNTTSSAMPALNTLASVATAMEGHWH